MKLLLCRDDDNVDVLMGRGMWVVVVRAIHDDDDDGDDDTVSDK